MIFEPQKTYAGRMIKWDKIIASVVFLSPFFLLASAVFGAFALYLENERFLGFFTLFFLIFLFLENIGHFRTEKLKKTVLKKETDNLADFLEFDLVKIFLRKKPKNPSALLYFILKEYSDLSFVFYRMLLSPKKVMETLKREISEEKEKELFSLLELSKDIAKRKGREIIEGQDVLLASFLDNSSLNKMAVLMDISSEDIESVFFWLSLLKEKRKDLFWTKGALGKRWISGYSLTLDTYGIDITEQIRRYVEFISHKEEADILERALLRSQRSNALIVGNPGSGRKSVVYNLAQRSLFGKGLEEINYKRVIEVDMESLLARIQNKEQVEFTLDKIFKEAASAGDIILVVNNIHEFVGGEDKLGTVDVTGIVAPFLNMPDFKFIGITDYTGLHERIEKNASFLNLFEKIEISEVGKQQTLKILQTLVPYYERKNKVFVSYLALKEIVDLSDKYLPTLFFPEKGIEILEEVVLFVSKGGKGKMVLKSHVASVISRKTDIPVGEVAEKEKEILLNLENLIHERIINQKEAVMEISTSLRRARAEIKTRKGPMGSFLFLGPTGVGKTETAKALADIYFGSEKRIIRLDMSEFQNVSDVSRLIGGKEETGMLTSPVKESPFSLLLLDELEKAHPNILNLFLQVLDEGNITDGFERKVDFKNTIIIATSNAGYQIILDAIENKNPWERVKEMLLTYVFKTGIFKPEFINRFDKAVVFHPLSKENLIEISNLILSSLKDNLKKKGIELFITEELKEKIVELSYDPKFGAREMRRVIQEKIENNLAEAVLLGSLQKGNKVEINPENFQLKIS
ncbi:MAG: ATP-dependent Clp protease ATP-binding subunit [Candidatus Paceibacterota bacterium]